MQRVLRRHYALPPEHGAWIWWIGPLAVGAAAGGRPGPDLALLALTALAAFLLRQPATIAVKAMSGRRPHRELAPSLVWCGIYGAATAIGVALLAARGHGRLLVLAIPGVLIFGWHLWLVGRREERRQPGVEIVAAGALALAAPAAYWVSGGTDNSEAWLLWALTWLQSAASIVHIYLRLRQRELPAVPTPSKRWEMGRRSLLYHTFNLGLSLVLAVGGWVPRLVPVAFGVSLADALASVVRPAVGQKPSRIGLRQLIVGILFVVVMVLAYTL